MNGILGFNTRVIGVSRDEIMAAHQRVGGAVMLCHNDGDLVRMANATGVTTIYRQSGDQSYNQDAGEFVRTRAEKGATYVHLTNEIVSSPQLHTWTRKALQAATALGVKAVAYNYGTNAARWQFRDAYDNLVYMRDHGHILGVHLYPDGKPDHEATLSEFLTLKHELGLNVICTEFGYLRDFLNGTEGWRGIWNAEQRAAFLDKWAPFFYAEQIPVCQFCFDPWDQPTVEKAKSDGLGYWDYPDVLSRMAALNKLYQWKGISMPTPTPAPSPIPTINVPASPGAATVMRIRATTLNLRTDHAVSAPVVRALAHGEQVAVFPATATALLDNYAWVYVEASKEKGWAALRGAWGESFTSVDAPVFRLINPVGCESVISSMFGVARDYNHDGDFAERHEGLDVSVAHKGCHPPIISGANGIVTKVSNVGDYGNHLLIESKVGTETFIVWYCHLAAYFVKEGDTVSTGQYIGVMGSTGNSTGLHLHLNVQHVGQGLSGFVIPWAVDPLPLISPAITPLAKAA